MVKIFQNLLISVFILINLFIFIPSFIVLLDGWNVDSTAKNPPELPTPPSPLILETLDKNLDPKIQEEQAKVYQYRVTAYTQQVTAYIQQVNAYKIFTENAYKTQGNTTNKSNRLEIYRTVVKDSILPLFGTLLTTLVGYVFVKVSAELTNNYIRAKNNQDVLPIKIWE